MEQLDRAADDVALSALIDNELTYADAEKLRARLRCDAWLARRFVALSQATMAIRLAYRDAIDVVATVASAYRHAIREACGDSFRGRSVPGPYSEEGPAPPLREVDLAVAGLTSEQRCVLCLAVLEDLDYLEIAAALRVPGTSVMVRLAEARAALADRLGKGLMPAASNTRH